MNVCNYFKMEYRIILFNMKQEELNYSKITVTFYRAREYWVLSCKLIISLENRSYIAWRHLRARTYKHVISFRSI